MACRFEITLASQHAVWVPAARAALDTIDRLEAELSVFREDSAISRLNRRAALGIEGDGVEIALETMLRCFDCSSGAATFIATPVARSTSRPRHSAAVGDSCSERAAFRRLRPSTRPARGSGSTEWHSTRCVALSRFEHSGIELNLGAIGKGYALDCVAVEMRRAGVTDALLSAGRSSLLAIGGGARGWDVEVVSARATQEGAPRPLARLRLRDVALGTSGAGEQFVIADGTRYGHVIDPRTGWPASGVLSASVVTSSAADADALSTAFLVGGLQLAERYCADHPGVLALVTPDDGSERPLIFGKSAGASVRTTE